jgi:hypothetical protein
MTAAERQRRHRLGLATPRGARKEENMAIVKALPVTRRDLEASRVLKARPTILDQVEPIVVALWEDDNFKKLVDAIVDSDAVEGSLEIDDTMAAMTIRQYARDHHIVAVENHNLHTLRHAFRLVCKRYGVGRKQRAGEPNGDAPATAE